MTPEIWKEGVQKQRGRRKRTLLAKVEERAKLKFARVTGDGNRRDKLGIR